MRFLLTGSETKEALEARAECGKRGESRTRATRFPFSAWICRVQILFERRREKIVRGEGIRNGGEQERRSCLGYHFQAPLSSKKLSLHGAEDRVGRGVMRGAMSRNTMHTIELN